MRGGVAVAVILVGALLAATTGVVAAAVISMGLISLPIMLRYGYNRTIATGTITASGTLAQAIPPSLVLIVLADQLGRSVGDMYAGALLPGAAAGRAVPVVRRCSSRSSGRRGCRRCRPRPASTASPAAPAATARWWCCWRSAPWRPTLWTHVHHRFMVWATERSSPSPGDEVLIMAMTVASLLALALALINRVTRMGLLSQAGRSRSRSC